jgi:hypothetical protein
MRVDGVKGIGFGLGFLESALGKPMDIVCRVGVNVWQGKREVQMVVDDVRYSSS